MESQIEQKFFQFLSELGFPKSAVIYESVFQPIGTDQRYRPDFVLLDPMTSEPLAIIEIKGRSDPKTLSLATQQMQQYVTALRDKAVRGFVATPAQSGEGFDFYTIGEEGEPKQVSSSLLQLESLSSARVAEKKERLAEEKRETTDQFVIVCFTAAVFAVVITVADFICSLYGITLLTAERMALVGAAIALVIIPYVQKFKGLGIEIDRVAKQDKD
jgi:hypothetical protein